MGRTISRVGRLMAAAAIIVVLVLSGGAGRGYANLTGSTFESNDGNMIVNTAGNEDWANAPNLTTATDYPSGTKTDNSFTTGSKEDDTSPVVGIAGVPPNKNDLINFYTGNETVSGTTFLYLAFTRAQTSGNADVDFEVNHANLGTTPTGTGTCPAGETAENGVCIPLNRTDGDALFQFIFPGGGGPITSLQIWRWASSASSQYFVPVKGVTNSAGCLSSSSGPPCWSDPMSPSASQFEGTSNTTAISNPLNPSCVGNCLAIATFGEAAINLNATGIFPAGTCSHFGGAWAKSRSSDSGSSALQDVIAPVPTNINNCATIKVTKVTQNGDSTFNYSTTGGLSPSTFTLSNGQTQTYSSVLPGSYSVTEGAEPSGWSFVSLACTHSGSTGDSISGTTASISVSGAGEVDCTYTNHVNLSPTISTTLSNSSVPVNSSVNDTATLSGATSNAGGTVTYYYSTHSDCSSPTTVNTVTVTNGSVPNSSSVQFTAVGTYYWQAVYSGDTNNNGATSTCGSEVLTVNPYSPSISTSLSSSSAPIGSSVSDSATLSNASTDAGGTVTYYYSTHSDCSSATQVGSPVTVTNGSVPDSSSVTFNNAGTYYWQAVYSGDGKNNGATSTCGSEVLVVPKNSPGMTTAQNVIPNDSSTLTGTTSSAGGTITFSLFSPSDATCSGTPALTQTVNVSGTGTYSTSNSTFIASTAGTWRWLVTYSGDSNNNGQTETCGTENFSITNG